MKMEAKINKHKPFITKTKSSTSLQIHFSQSKRTDQDTELKSKRKRLDNLRKLTSLWRMMVRRSS